MPHFKVIDAQGRQKVTSDAGFGVLIEEKIFDGTIATYNFASIPQTYRHLHMTWWGRVTSTGSGNNDIYIQFNGDTAGNYDEQYLLGNNISTSTTGTYAASKPNCFAGPQASVSAGYVGTGYLTIPNYSDANFHKGADVHLISKTAQVAGGLIVLERVIMWRNAAAISSILVGVLTSGNFANHSRLALYGIL